MKKTVSFMLAAVMTATILTGCGGSGIPTQGKCNMEGT